MKYWNELKKAVLNENFYETEEVIIQIESTDNSSNEIFNYIESILLLMEENPDLDYGEPGPLVHFMEKYYRKGYEERLVDSIKRRPTMQTVWMINRIINDPKLLNKQDYLDVLSSVANYDNIDKVVKDEINSFLDYQNNKE